MTEQRANIPDPEVREKRRRRRFTAKYKLEILKEVEENADVGEILRREGLYTSHLSAWRKQRDEGALEALGKKRGRKPRAVDPSAREIAELKRENERLQHKLRQAETIIGVQKKLSEVLGIELPETEPSGRSS